MEDSEGSPSTLAGFTDRRRRSSKLRRPRDIKASLQSFTFMPSSTHVNIAPTNEANPSIRNGDSNCGSTSENKLKLKLKLGGGVTRTFQTNSEAGIYTKATDDGRKPFQKKVKGNVPEQRHVQKTMYLGEIHQSRVYPSETLNGASLCEKSKRGLKKRVLDAELDSDDDGDEEIRYLEKLKSKRVTRDYHEGKESEGHISEDKELLSSDKHGVPEKKKMRMGMVDSTSGQIPTTRTRALQSGKDQYSVIGSGPLEFPDGLPCISSKRQKQKLSEVEQQSKKEEAAQRRRIQSEKAAQEAEAEAIRKILGQDSGRKKREEKIKKQQEERAQERAARSSTLASNTVRLVIGPSGTTLTFSEDIGLPDIFKPITYSYPPPREKCVGPNCEKTYKYRDAKSKLPLCNWICTVRIKDDSYPSPGLTVNVFSNKPEQLPRIRNQEDIILFIRIKMKSFDGGKGVNAACNKTVSSFAVYERSTSKDFVCYQRTSNFHEEAQYKSYIADLHRLLASSSRVDQALQSESYGTIAETEGNFSFLREIKQGKCFDLVCKILHVNEDMTDIFVWDGTDAPPAPILAYEIEEGELSSLSVKYSLLSRDILLGFPTVGTILRVSLSSHLYHWVKPGEWVKLYHLLCEVDNGSWIGKATDSTEVQLARDERLVQKITRIYDKRMSSKLGHIPFWSFPSPPGLTETDNIQAPFVTLMDIITFPKVTYKYSCIVRFVAAHPSQVEDLCSNENSGHRVLFTLEDPTATLDAFLCDKDAEYFWGLGFQNTDMLRNKWNQLLGITESSKCVTPRNPPWIECCILSYYTHKADPWKTRFYKIFATRLLD
ncbi:unnamed protein product [Arabis nemorensis]|uniref:INO80 complex subunit B-like conserved region domain-containing protein n=1 Tax=Arabis nemorensis TaxID=586526 RepID=A0A565B7J4_9BRAS|nr:unnamed protein product [Arabis nemorensis]